MPCPLPGDLPTQGSNPCLLHWQTDSLPLSCQGSLLFIIFYSPFNIYRIYLDVTSLISDVVISAISFFLISLARVFINFIDLLKEPAFDLMSFLYCRNSTDFHVDPYYFLSVAYFRFSQFSFLKVEAEVTG